MNPCLKILIIDDELQIRRFLKAALEPHHFQTIEASSGAEGLTLAASHKPDIVILDLGLPDKDGQTVLQELREWYQNPIVVLSVRDDEGNIVQALDNGANDYLRKPFLMNELLARLRLTQRSQSTAQSQPILQFEGLIIDLPDHKVTLNGREIKLTVTEFELLKNLALNAGKVLTHKQLLARVWGERATENTHYLRIYIGHLRQKIENDATQPEWIITEPGVGYRFTALN